MEGRNQGIVAKALKDGYRKKVYVATKVSADSKEDMSRKIDESLAALEVDYVDIATRGSAASAQEVMDPGLREAMAQARAEGKIRFLGIPTHKNEAEVVNAVVDDPGEVLRRHFCAVQLQVGRSPHRGHRSARPRPESASSP